MRKNELLDYIKKEYKAGYFYTDVEDAVVFEKQGLYRLIFDRIELWELLDRMDPDYVCEMLELESIEDYSDYEHGKEAEELLTNEFDEQIVEAQEVISNYFHFDVDVVLDGDEIKYFVASKSIIEGYCDVDILDYAIYDFSEN